MGYDISIVRYDGEEAVEIPESEWLEYIKTDPELEMSKIANEDSQYWEWNAHSQYQDPEGGRPWFQYWRGRIYSKNPDEEVAAKMFQIATTLNARVQGQDGEFYDEDGRQIDEGPQINEPSRIVPKSKQWWRFW
jgi:hypothetical protein